MIEFLKNWVLTIVTLALFIILLEIIIPSGKTKKFINLISGFILIISIINPFLTQFRHGIDLKKFQIADSNFIDRKEIEKNSRVLQESQMKQVAETYRNKIISQLVDGLSDIKNLKDIKGDVIINEDYTSDSFGEIKRIYVSFRQDDIKKSIEKIPHVKEVKINGKDIKEEKQETKPKVDDKVRNEIEKRLSKLFDISREIIVINLEE